MAKMLRIELTKSPIGASPTQRRTVQALGLRKMHRVVTFPDDAGTRGAIKKIAHLVTVTEEE